MNPAKLWNKFFSERSFYRYFINYTCSRYFISSDMMSMIIFCSARTNFKKKEFHSLAFFVLHDHTVIARYKKNIQH